MSEEAKKEKVFIVTSESLLESILSDLCTIGIIAGGVWFNERFVGGSGFVNGCLLILFIVWILSRASSKSKRFYSPEDLKRYAEELIKP